MVARAGAGGSGIGWNKENPLALGCAFWACEALKNILSTRLPWSSMVFDT
jgi:hypothetical protein